MNTTGDQWAITLAICAAFAWGIGAHLIRQGLHHLDAQRGSAISIISTTLCLCVVVSLTGLPSELWCQGLIAFAVAGLVHPVLSRFLAFEANRRVGATISNTFDSTSPLFAAVLAIIILGEVLTTGIVIGTLMTILGVTFICWQPVKPKSIMRIAVYLAIGAAFVRAIGVIAGKFGLNSLPSPIVGALVTFTVSAIVALIIARVQKKTIWRHLGSAGTWWFVLLGLVSALATVCMYSALLHTDAIVVIPIIAASPLFTWLSGWILGLEQLGISVAIAIAITVVGVSIIGLSTL